MTNPVDVARAHIQRLHDEKYNADMNDPSHGLADAANHIINDELEGNICYELLQNFNDCPGENKEPAISFKLNKNRLTVSHNGRSFSEKDVIKICRIAQSEYGDKKENPTMIGHKGVGFRSCMHEERGADQVIIYSHPYCFKFDQKYHKWNNPTHQTPYPWQITPIWVEVKDLPQDEELDPNQTHFILRLRNPTSIRDQLEEIRNNSNILLFLNNIQKIHLRGVVLRKEAPSEHERKIYYNDSILSRWYFASDLIEKTPEVQEAVVKLSDKSCPKRYKKPDFRIRIDFAFYIKPEGLTPVKDSFLSCYLPTQERCNLPFLVSGDFFVEGSRQRLNKGPKTFWNSFILEMIAKRHFHWLSQVALDPTLRDRVLYMLAPRELQGLDPVLTQEYAMGYQQAANITPFIPSQKDSSKLLKLVKCKVDESGFVRYKQSGLGNESISHKYVSHLLANVSVLSRDHEVPVTTFKDVVMDCRNFPGDDLTLVVPFLEFFRANWDRALKFDSRFLEFFHNNCLLPYENGSFKPIAHFFLTSEQLEQENWIPSCLDIPVYHEEDFKEYPALLQWLQDPKGIGLKKLHPQDIIQGPLLKFVEERKVNKNNTQSIVRFLALALRDQFIKERDLEAQFAHLPLLTQSSQMVFPSQCYLANQYGPHFSLQNLVPSNSSLFISATYLSNDIDVTIWRELFIALGVRDRIEVTFPRNLSISELRNQHASFLDKYIDFLFNDPKQSPSSKRNDQHQLLNFVYVPYMEFLHVKSYAHHFWKEILSQWDKILPLCEKAQYKSPNQKAHHLPISYLEYSIKNGLIYSISGKAWPAKDLYAPQLSHLVSEWMPVVSLPEGVSMTAKQAQFFGFKTTVHPIDCLDIFDAMRQSNKLNSEAYKYLLEHLLEHYDDLPPEEKQKFQKHQKYVITEDKKWKNCNDQDLICLLTTGLQSSFRSTHVECCLDPSKMEKLGSIFGFKIRKTDEFVIEGGTEDKTFTKELHEKLSLFAFFEAKYSCKDPMQVLIRLVKLARAIKIFEASLICSSTNRALHYETTIQDSILYHCTSRTEKDRKVGKELCKYFQLHPQTKKLFSEIMAVKRSTITDKELSAEDFIRKRFPDEKEKRNEVDLYRQLKNLYDPRDLTLKISEEEFPQTNDNSNLQPTPSPSTAHLFAEQLSPQTKPSDHVNKVGEKTTPSSIQESDDSSSSSDSSQSDEESSYSEPSSQSKKAKKPQASASKPTQTLSVPQTTFPAKQSHFMEGQESSKDLPLLNNSSPLPNNFPISLLNQQEETSLSKLEGEESSEPPRKKSKTSPTSYQVTSPAKKDGSRETNHSTDSNFEKGELHIDESSSNKQAIDDLFKDSSSEPEQSHTEDNVLRHLSEHDGNNTLQSPKSNPKTVLPSKQIASSGKQNSPSNPSPQPEILKKKPSTNSTTQTTHSTSGSKSKEKTPKQSSEGNSSPLQLEEDEIYDKEPTGFNPALDPEKVDVARIVVKRFEPKVKTTPAPGLRNLLSVPKTTQRTNQPKQSQPVLREIGYWGEKVMFRYFLQHYKNHKNLRYIDHKENGREVKIFCKNSDDEDITVEVVWLNPDKKEDYLTTDSGEQRDIDLKWFRGNEVIKQRWIDIKTSIGKRIHLILSTQEWEFMSDHREEYRIYHVADAESKDPVVRKIKDILMLKPLNQIEFVG